MKNMHMLRNLFQTNHISIERNIDTHEKNSMLFPSLSLSLFPVSRIATILYSGTLRTPTAHREVVPNCCSAKGHPTVQWTGLY